MSRIRIPERLANVDGKVLALSLAAAVLLAALWGPTARLERPVYQYLFILDITQSMNTLDYTRDGRPVSRLAYAKGAIRQALARLPCGSRVGLGIFTEHRSMVLIAPVEVCGAYTELTTTLARLDWRMAWAGASEVAKGLYSALRLARQIEPRPTVVFVTDGHEAPPLDPAHRAPLAAEAGAVAGLIVGTGGFAPMRIPKYDMAGDALGYWSSDDVVQSIGGGRGPASAEHLSSLRESYLQSLAQEAGLHYRRLATAADLGEALTAREWTRPMAVSVDLRPLLGWLALAFLIAAYATGRSWPSPFPAMAARLSSLALRVRARRRAGAA
ncbi:MAG: VWA domain-containing protein [Sulfurifustaceae bacterium]